MYNIIERYMDKLSISDVNEFAKKNNVFLSNEELNFTYKFVKKNWQIILANPSALNLDRYKDKFSEENMLKIKMLIKKYLGLYKNYL
jgi:hypothetical protein